MRQLTSLEWPGRRTRTSPRAADGGPVQPDTDVTESAGPPGPRRGRMTAAVVFGLVGMLTGTVSLYITWRTTSEQAAVVLDAYPTASAEDLTHAGFGVRVQLVNKSLRPLVVTDAALWVDGAKISDATGYLDDVQLLDRSALAPAAITDNRRDFPISMNAREGRSVAILMDVWRPIVYAESAEATLIARSELNQLLTSVRSLAEDEVHEIELTLELAPGGLQRFDVRSHVQPGVYPEAIRDSSAIERQAPLEIWLVEPLASRRGFSGLSLRRRFAGEGQVDLVRLDVWGEDSKLHRALIRPIVGQQARLFELDLPEGVYVATFRVAGAVIAYRSFSVPFREERCHVGEAGAAPVWCPPT